MCKLLYDNIKIIYYGIYIDTHTFSYAFLYMYPHTQNVGLDIYGYGCFFNIS